MKRCCRPFLFFTFLFTIFIPLQGMTHKKDRSIPIVVTNLSKHKAQARVAKLEDGRIQNGEFHFINIDEYMTLHTFTSIEEYRSATWRIVFHFPNQQEQPSLDLDPLLQNRDSSIPHVAGSANWIIHDDYFQVSFTRSSTNFEFPFTKFIVRETGELLNYRPMKKEIKHKL